MIFQKELFSIFFFGKIRFMRYLYLFISYVFSVQMTPFFASPNQEENCSKGPMIQKRNQIMSSLQSFRTLLRSCMCPDCIIHGYISFLLSCDNGKVFDTFEFTKRVNEITSLSICKCSQISNLFRIHTNTSVHVPLILRLRVHK